MTLNRQYIGGALAGLVLAVAAMVGGAQAQQATANPPADGAPMRLDGYGVTTSISGSRARAIMDLQNGTGAGRGQITGMESGAMWDNYVKSIGKGGAGAPLKTTVTEGVDSGR